MPVLSAELERAVRRMINLAAVRGHDPAGLEHLLLGLTGDEDARAALEACGCDTAGLQAALSAHLDRLELPAAGRSDQQPEAGYAVRHVFTRAAMRVQSEGRDPRPGQSMPEILGSDVLLSLIDDEKKPGPGEAGRFLAERGVSRRAVADFIARAREKPQ